MCTPEASPGVYLVRPAYKVHVVFVQKFCHHISPEREGDATVVFTPAQHVLVRVGPQQVTQQTLVRHVCGPHYPADLLHGLKIGREAWGDITHLSLVDLMQTPFKVIQTQPTSMTAEDFLIYNSSHRQTVEAICEGLPQLYVIPSFT